LKAKFHNGFVNRWRKQTSLQSSFWRKCYQSCRFTLSHS
jgi:hypothetical protein